jgi:hypothetical protein
MTENEPRCNDCGKPWLKGPVCDDCYDGPRNDPEPTAEEERQARHDLIHNTYGRRMGDSEVANE